MSDDNVTIHCPATLAEFLALRKQHPEALIVGNSILQGAFYDFHAMNYEFLGCRERFSAKAKHNVWLSTSRVQELQYASLDDKGVNVGAGLSIQQLADKLQVAVENMKRKCRCLCCEMIRNTSSGNDSSSQGITAQCRHIVLATDSQSIGEWLCLGSKEDLLSSTDMGGQCGRRLWRLDLMHYASAVGGEGAA